MRTCWEASRQGWEIFIDDPADPALSEFGFPGTAAAWLHAPAEWVEGWDVIDAISPKFMERVRRWLRIGDVQAVCLADAAEARTGEYPDVVRRGFRHYAHLGPDWTDTASWIHSEAVPEWVYSLALPLEPMCGAPPDWDAFSDTSTAFRRACELLAGVGFGGANLGFRPVIRPCSWWEDRRSGVARPPDRLLEEVGDAAVRTLQVNYYGVVTHLVAPGRVVRTDQGRGLRFLERSPEAWLAKELEGGTREQPRSAQSRA